MDLVKYRNSSAWFSVVKTTSTEDIPLGTFPCCVGACKNAIKFDKIPDLIYAVTLPSQLWQEEHHQALFPRYYDIELNCKLETKSHYGKSLPNHQTREIFIFYVVWDFNF